MSRLECLKTTISACIGNQGSPINHNKFFLFSSTDGAANVVFQTSSNFSEGNYTNQYNNALQIVGNTVLYNGFVAYFNDLAAQAKTNDYYTARPFTRPSSSPSLIHRRCASGTAPPTPSRFSPHPMSLPEAPQRYLVDKEGGPPCGVSGSTGTSAR